MKLKIYIENEQDKLKFTFKYKRLIKKAVKTALEFEDFSKDCEVSVTVTDNERIRAINKEHRNIDAPTDVLSFPMFDEDFEDEAAVLGDIVLSLERAKVQAGQYGHSFERELAFLTVHSVLHLLGYDHEQGEAEEGLMFGKQEEILKIMGLGRK